MLKQLILAGFLIISGVVVITLIQLYCEDKFGPDTPLGPLSNILGGLIIALLLWRIVDTKKGK